MDTPWMPDQSLAARLAARIETLRTELALGERRLAALESERLKARLGEMLLERELLEAKITLLEARDPGPLARPRRRR